MLQKVYLDYTQEDLDDVVFNTRLHPPGPEKMIERYARASARARARFNHRSFAYGSAASETLDYFFTDAANRPIQVFIHGGAWRLLSKQEASFLAPVFVEHGCNFVALDFSLVPLVRVPQMVEQVRRALGWIARNARELGADPDRIFIAGHSSCAHLAAVALTTNWDMHALPTDLLKGGLCISGLYDLRPVLLSRNFAHIELTPDEEVALTPIRHAAMARCPILLAHAEFDPPEAKRQAEAFAGALKDTSCSAETIVAAGHNHWTILESLGQPESELAVAALAQCGTG